MALDGFCQWKSQRFLQAVSFGDLFGLLVICFSFDFVFCETLILRIISGYDSKSPWENFNAIMDENDFEIIWIHPPVFLKNG